MCYSGKYSISDRESVLSMGINFSDTISVLCGQSWFMIIKCVIM